MKQEEKITSRGRGRKLEFYLWDVESTDGDLAQLLINTDDPQEGEKIVSTQTFSMIVFTCMGKFCSLDKDRE